MTELFDQIAALTGNPALSEEAGASQLSNVAALHGINGDRVYWWAGLHRTPRRVPYDDGSAGLALLDEVLGNLQLDEVVLVATDEAPRPWPMWVLRRDELIALLEALPFFEYFVAAPDGRTLVFDTHHNELLIASLDAPGDVHRAE
ncbi:hypothetical protein [Stenotrophomonas rhizophila]|uniref:hypothetical protein n=1 Tax=Stenotrophomonas rhizophila TaxID=216778 RepID=UPI0028D5A082|nr:hypothetical protein [Stenotrophomonas rhizophila]